MPKRSVQSSVTCSACSLESEMLICVQPETLPELVQSLNKKAKREERVVVVMATRPGLSHG